MLVEDLIFEIEYKKNGIKHINNYIIDEINENWCSYKGEQGEFYNKIMGLLHANIAIVDSIEKILSNYQEQVDEHYAELIKTEA